VPLGQAISNRCTCVEVPNPKWTVLSLALA
jgi:hypothetical protein